MALASKENDVQLAHGPVQSGSAEAEHDLGVPIDHAHLSRYTLSDRGLEIEILKLFLAQIPLTVESLKFASMDKDWVIAAHTLKGSARAVGVPKLAELALEAEQLGGIADAGACRCLIAKIEAAARETENYIKENYATS